MEMRPFGRLLPVRTASERVLHAIRPVTRSETVLLGAAANRVAAQTYRAREPVPAFARSTWDGYAFASAQTRHASKARPARFRVVGEVFADRGYARRLEKGEAVAIAAGGRLPPGADTMEIFEVVSIRRNDLRVPHFVPPTNRIAEPGEDFSRGMRLVAKGDLLTPSALGALAASGRDSVRVYVRPRVAIIPNGDELRSPGHRLGSGQIYESNNFALGAVVQACGGEARMFAPVPDRPERIIRAIRRALGSTDLVLVTGGSSVGEHDYLAQVFPRIGRLLFHGIAVRPGKPTIAALARGRLVLGMPGHPTSCLSNSYWLLLPAMRRLARRRGPGWTPGIARLAEGCEPPSPDLATVLPLRVVHGWGYPTFHGSHAITSLAGANAFAMIPPRFGPLRRGRRLPVNFLPPPLVGG